MGDRKRTLGDTLGADQFDSLVAATYDVSDEGPFDYAWLNRVRNLADATGGERERGGYATVYQPSDGGQYWGFDALLLDHCALRTVGTQDIWYNPGRDNARHDYDAALYAIEAVIDLDASVDVYILHDMEEKLADDVGQDGAAAFMAEIRPHTAELVVDEDIPVPAEYRGSGSERGMTEDYRILKSADQSIPGNVLVMTTDADIPWLATRLFHDRVLEDGIIAGLPAPMVQDAAEARKDVDR